MMEEVCVGSKPSEWGLVFAKVLCNDVGKTDFHYFGVRFSPFYEII